MTEKLIHSLPPTTALPPFVTFEDCKKGETAAKTGCTPASGGGGKKEGAGESAEAMRDLMQGYDDAKAKWEKNLGDDFDEKEFNDWFATQVPGLSDALEKKEGSKKPTDEEIDEFEKDLDRIKEEMDKGGSGEDEDAVKSMETAASKLDIDDDLREEILDDLWMGMGSSDPTAEDFEDRIETYKEEVAGFASRIESLKESGGPPGETEANIVSMEQSIEMEEEKIEAMGKLKEAAGFGGSEAPAAEETGGEGKGSQQEQFNDLLKAEDEAFSDEAYAKSFYKAVEKYKPIKTEEKLVSAAWEVERALESTNEENEKKIEEGKVAEIDLEKISDLNEEASHLRRWIKDIKEQGGFRGIDDDTGRAEWTDDNFPIMRLLSAPSKVKGPHRPKSPFAK